MTTPSIMAYVASSDGLAAGGGDSFIPDAFNNRTIRGVSGTSSNDGIRLFTGWTSGDEYNSANLAAIGVPGLPSQVGGFAYSPGNLLCFAVDGSNSTRLALVNGSTLKLMSLFGVSSGSLSPSTSSRILTPAVMAPLNYGTNYFFVATPVAGNKGEIDLLTYRGGVLVNTNLGTTSEGNAGVGGYVRSGSSATMYLLGFAATLPTTAALGLYAVTVGQSNSGTLTRIGGVTPAQIDATWTHFSSVQGCAIDQADGNPIILVGTSDAVTNTAYLAKLSATTAAVLWTCVVNNVDGDFFANAAYHSITNQTFYYMGNGGVLYTVNTATGVASSATLSTWTTSGGQVSEDTYNSLFVYGSWTQNTTTPSYIGDYMGTQGNHTLTNQWARWFPTGPTPPTVPVQPTLTSSAASSRAWTYTMDGHTFYVLDLGSQGTFLFDTTTKQWTQFQTNGQTGWDFINGGMWYQRVIGGDNANGQVYELQPDALQDYSALDIQHTVTGGLTMRSRVYRSCAAIRLALSWGEDQDVSAASISLSYSDDWGQTFSAPSVLNLTEGDFTTEITWRSLGSFAAPGRIFSIADTGGPLRIDGCDCALDDFDDDEPQEQG